MNICFVCSGNICRSPLAEGLFRFYIEKKAKGKYTVHSAGTLNLPGEEASEGSVIVAKEYGTDISSHRSRHLTEDIAAESDIIIVMAKKHLSWIKQNLEEHFHKAHLLTDYGKTKDEQTHEDIQDPIGMGTDYYRKVGAQINAEVKRIVEFLEPSSK